jgi:hypothetical protein
MKLATLLLLAPALLAAALPAPANDILSEIAAGESSPETKAKAPPIYALHKGYSLPKGEAEAEAESHAYIKRIGYGPGKREASPEAEAGPLFYFRRTGYGPSDKRKTKS